MNGFKSDITVFAPSARSVPQHSGEHWSTTVVQLQSSAGSSCTSIVGFIYPGLEKDCVLPEPVFPEGLKARGD
jgi:hypothetical protein